MKRKGLIIILLALVCLLFVLPSNKSVEAGTETWTLVKNVNNLTVGDKIVIAAADTSYKKALSTTQNKNNRGAASITIDGNTISFGSDVQIIVLEAGTKTNTFAFKTDSGYLYAASSSSNYLRTQTSKNDNASWMITITSAGIATIKAQGTNTKNTLWYNTSSLFGCYSTTSNSSKDVSIYKLTSIEEPDTPDVPNEPEVKTIAKLFDEYYNNGNYRRDTKIFVNTGEIVFNKLKQHFHASDSALNRVENGVTTYFCGNTTQGTNDDYLWFNDDNTGYGHGYGAKDGKLTSITVSSTNITVGKEHNDIDGCEAYYCTLNDFVEGKHSSAHVDNQTLNLETGWEHDSVNNRYYNEEEDVIKAFVLFTAPTWLPLTDNTSLMLDYTRVTVEENDGKLEMKLWVSSTNDGLLGATVTEEEHSVFSQATISKEIPTVPTVGNVEQVKNVNQLFDGAQVILTYGTQVAMGKENAGKFQASVSATINGNIADLNDTIQIVTLVKVGDYWALKLGDKYLNYTGSENEVYLTTKTNLTSTDKAYLWDITVDSTGTVVIQNESVSERVLQYNASSPRFACYKSTQKNPTMYLVIA